MAPEGPQSARCKSPGKNTYMWISDSRAFEALQPVRNQKELPYNDMDVKSIRLVDSVVENSQRALFWTLDLITLMSLNATSDVSWKAALLDTVNSRHSWRVERAGIKYEAQ